MVQMKENERDVGSQYSAESVIRPWFEEKIAISSLEADNNKHW